MIKTLNAVDEMLNGAIAEEAAPQGSFALNRHAHSHERTSQESETSKKTRKRFEHNRDYAPSAAYDLPNWGSPESDTWLQPKKHWTESIWGKVGIEFVSRITLGGMFYALVGQSESMRQVSSNYDPATFLQKEKKTWLEWMAYGVDRTLGAGLKQAALMAYNGDRDKAEAFTRFRPQRFRADASRPYAGRSYGAEFTSVVADFGGMTVGTAIAREMLNSTLNPKERKAWLKDGKFDPGHMVRRLGSKLWEILSYNLGEDLVATAPYVFFLRGCRNMIDKKIAPGFANGSDYTDNGGSLVADREGYILSEHQLAGIIDLEARFVGYNVLTQMYRDGYNWAGKNFNQWQKNGYALETPEFIKDPATIPEKTIKGIKGTARYMVISTIRSLLQMIPAVPFFSIFRVPASKPNGLIVNPELGMAVFKNPDGTLEPLRRNGSKTNPQRYTREVNPDDPIYWSNTIGTDNEVTLKRNPVGLPTGGGRYHVYGSSAAHRNLQYSSLSRLTDAIGRNMHKISNHPVWEGMSGWFWDVTGNGKDPERRRKLSKEAAIAGIPYATYFSSKVFFREQYVNMQMNLAIGHMLDGFLSLNSKRIREGISEIQRTMLGLPLRDPKRQAELITAHLYHPEDKSPLPENWNAQKHRKFIEAAMEGKEPDPLQLTAEISQQRADFYTERAEKERKKMSHGIQPGQSLNALLIKQQGVTWTDQQQPAAEEKDSPVLAGTI